MKLRTVIATECMGASFRVDLDDLNLILGGNDKGKTRLKNAITLLLLGYLPTLDKKPAAIFKLSSGRRMELVGEFDNGELIVRTWERKGESVKAVHSVPESFDGKTPMVLLDGGDYFSRTARGRVEMVFSVAKIEGDQQAAINKGLVENGITCAPENGEGVQEFIDRALETVELFRGIAAADARRYTGTLQGVTALQLQDKPATRDVNLIDQEIDALQTGRVEAITEHVKLIDAQEQDEVNDLERERLTALLKDAPKIREFDVEELRRREKRIQQEIANEQGRKLRHDLWKQRVEYRDREKERLTLGLRALEEQEVDTAPDKCKECGRSFDDEETLQAVIAHRLKAKERALQNQRQQIDNLTAGKNWDEPPQPNDTAQLEADLESVRADMDAHAKSVEAKGWRSQLEALPTSKDRKLEIETMTKAIADNTERLETLRAERREAESERADRRRLAQAQTELETAQANEERAKAAKNFLLKKKSELIEQVFGPLLKIANGFMDGIFSEPVEYRDGELGVFRGSSWVSEECFGGAKRAMLYAALQCALGAQSPCRIVPMDELLNMVTHLPRFLCNVKTAHETGIIDQFIGLIPTGELFPAEKIPRIDGFSLIEAMGDKYVRR